MKISSHNFTNQTARRGAERVLLAVFCVFFALLIAVGAGASTFLTAMAAEYTAYDRTAIEDDLRGVDSSAYPADENGRHFLLDDVGFMEYGYSESAFIVDNYFGIYLYAYNPTEREVSTRAGANVVNMATAYNEAGEPTNYENVPITVLDHTENHRFYKFRITDSSAIYTRANLYARAHDGVRRYDVAGIQLWFLGEDGTEADNSEDESVARTYTCTGYAEAVHVIFDTEVIGLERILQLYFKAIDPLSVNRQGADSGIRYRTGIYYTDPADLPSIHNIYDRVSGELKAPLAVEVKPLKNFYKAEEYHQDYLDKHPDGYCHIPKSLMEFARTASEVSND